MLCLLQWGIALDVGVAVKIQEPPLGRHSIGFLGILDWVPTPIEIAQRALDNDVSHNKESKEETIIITEGVVSSERRRMQ